MQRNKYKYIQFVISGADSPDEGEIKIFSWIYEHIKMNPIIAKEESYLLIGGDADFLLLSISTCLKNIYLITDPKKREMIYIWSLCRTFDQLFPNQSELIRYDFVFVRFNFEI